MGDLCSDESVSSSPSLLCCPGSLHWAVFQVPVFRCTLLRHSNRFHGNWQRGNLDAGKFCEAHPFTAGGRAGL
ncbi:hypothetical protein FKM82_016074 [Ascaphus truei]